MIMRSCNVLSDRDIRGVNELSDHTVSKVYRQLGCSALCGRCAPTIKKIVQERQTSLTRARA
jgi:bacterioferritin-associated ferredoxin